MFWSNRLHPVVAPDVEVRIARFFCLQSSSINRTGWKSEQVWQPEIDTKTFCTWTAWTVGVGAWDRRCHDWPHHSATLSGRDEDTRWTGMSARWQGFIRTWDCTVLIWIDRLIDCLLACLLVCLFVCLFVSQLLAGWLLLTWFRSKATDTNTGLAIHSQSLSLS